LRRSWERLWESTSFALAGLRLREQAEKDKAYNRAFARERIVVEHGIQRWPTRVKTVWRFMM